MFDWLKRLKTKASPTVNGVVLQSGTTLQYPHWKIREQVTDGYERNTVVYACINLVARTAAAIPLSLYSESGGDRNEILDPNHPLLKLMNSPNPTNGRAAFMTSVFTYWLSTGNSFIWANRIGSQPRQLWTLPPSRFKIMPGGDGKIGVVDYYVYSVDTAWEQKLKTEDMLHLKLFATEENEWFGLSPVQVGALVIDSDNVSVNWNRSLLSNRGKPDSVFIFKSSLGEQQREAFKARLDESYSGTANASKPLVVEGTDFTYQQLSSTPVELDYIASTSMTSRRICQLFGVAPELIGDPQNKTYSNQAEARLSLVEQTVFPLMDSLVDSFNNWLTPMFGENLKLEYDKDSVDVIAEKRAAKYTSLATADFLSVNEKRESVGYDRVDSEDADIPESLLNARVMQQPPFGANDEEPEEPEEPDEDELPANEGKHIGAGIGILTIESKYLNLDTEEKKLGFWKDIDNRRRVLEKGATKTFSSHFASEGKSVVAAFNRGGNAAALSVVTGNKKALESALRKTALPIARYFYNQARAALGGSKSLARMETKKSMLSGLSAYFSTEIPKKAASITNTSTDKIAEILRKGILGGDSDEAVAASLEKLYLEQFTKTRAAGIAETEVGNATNAGAVFGAKSTGKELQKVWVDQGDERVREGEFDHHGATVKAVGMDDVFVVSDEELEFPGDSSRGASPGNVINCRCNIAFQDAV